MRKPPFAIQRAQAGGLAVVGMPPAGLGEIRDGIAAELRVVHRVDVALAHVRMDAGEIVEDGHEVALHGRIVELPSAVTLHGVAEPDEGEASIVRGVGLLEDAAAPLRLAVRRRQRARDGERDRARREHEGSTQGRDAHGQCVSPYTM